jgi:dTDP-L-rhamnose 4-epimerase
MNILITGGAGFIGSAFARILIDRHGAKITAFDNLLEQVHPSRQPPSNFPVQARLVRGDVRDRVALDNLFEDYAPDFVVHFAAETGTGQSMTEGARHASVNVTGTAELLDSMRRHGRFPQRLLLSSSRAVYGEGAWIDAKGVKFYPGSRSRAQLVAGQWDFKGPNGGLAKPATQEARSVWPNPTSIYGATKLAQEHLMAAWCAAHDIPLSILRFQNVYGPGQSPTNPYTGIINMFHQIARRGETIPVYEDGQIGRDFVFIDDVVSACDAALLCQVPGRSCYDVGTGRVCTIIDAAKLIARLHNAPPPQICGKFREGDVRWAVASSDALAETLGCVAVVPFQEGAEIVGNWLFASS